MDSGSKLMEMRQRMAAEPPEHGVRARYMVGCRCLLCRAANSQYECARAAARRQGDVRGLVSAAPAIVHLLRLRNRNVGVRAVAAASGVARSILNAMLRGKHRRIRADTRRRILAVDATACVSDGALVPAGPTWRRIETLLEAGYTRSWIARQLGSRAEHPALQLEREWIKASSASKVKRLCVRIEQGRVSR